MSSTEKSAPEYSEFFDRLTKVAGGSALSSPTSRSRDSYYLTRSADPQSYIAEIDCSQLGALLRAQWANIPELQSLIPDLEALYARAETGDDDDGEVSPFIYEMF